MEYKRKTNHKTDSRWLEGIFLGDRVETTEKIIGTREGVFVVQSVRRVPEGRRYNTELLIEIIIRGC